MVHFSSRDDSPKYLKKDLFEMFTLPISIFYNIGEAAVKIGLNLEPYGDRTVEDFVYDNFVGNKETIIHDICDLFNDDESIFFDLKKI